jgi:quinol monooxygenase YgiN
MSVLVIAKFPGDTAVFRQALTERAEEFAKIAESSRAAGGLHHRFGIGDGFIVVVDEWESPAHFEQFFSDPALQAFIGSVGAAPAPPEITVSEAVASPDQY